MEGYDNIGELGAVVTLPISPLVGEMSGRTEGGTAPPTLQQIELGSIDDELRPTLPLSALPGISPSKGETTRVTVAAEQAGDITAREVLLDRAMGPGRRRKSSEKLRRGRKPSEGLAFVARDASGAVVGTVRLWDVTVELPISPLEGEMSGRTEGGAVLLTSPLIAVAENFVEQGRSVVPPSGLPAISPSRGEISSVDVPALLLGPLAVDPAVKSVGIGSALMQHAVSEAKRLGHAAILLVGDAPYYARFGFSAEKTGSLAMPGPYERHRFLALELVEGALDGVRGVLRASGRKIEASQRLSRAA